ncbi:MAG: SPOR domain-containing protein [Campylobacterota bacterium]
MEIKGDDFLKKIQKHQEREELEQKLNELNNTNNQIHETNDNSNSQTFEEVTNMTRQRESMHQAQSNDDQELDNIMLQGGGTTNENNKKKYLALGLVLVVLFLLTIIIIRLLSDDSKEDPFTQENNTATKQEDKDIEENFQKIMNDRVKKSNTDEQMVSEEKINQVKEDVTNPENNQIKSSQLESDLDKTIERIKEEKRKEMEAKKELEQRNKATKKEESKPKKSVQDLVKDASGSKPQGYFVQIGAFTKTPSQGYIQNIRDNNLKYKIYRVDVKGTMYNKVLIGPYSSRASAEGQIPDIKEKLNLSGAYVLKF